MTDTYCKYCAFSNLEEKTCFFDIPSLLPPEQIENKEGFTFIKNYQCRYGISEHDIKDHNIPLEELKRHAIKRNLIRYYIFFDLTEKEPEYIKSLVTIINNLDIKPKFISFLLNLKDNNHQLASFVGSNLDQSIKWKVHNWIKQDSLDHCRYTILATNLGANNSNCILFCKPKDDINTKTINSRVNYLHMSQIVKQQRAHVICNSLEDIDGLFMPNILYKEIMEETNLDRNLLGAIRTISGKEPGFKILKYEYE